MFGILGLLASLAAAVETPTSSGPVSQVDTPIFRIPMRTVPPTIDGVMDEAEWQDASALSGFWYDWAQSKFMFLASGHTQLQLYAAYDKDNLYFAYTSPVFPKNSWLLARGRYPDVLGHPQYGLQWDDHIELEIRPYHDVVKAFRMGLFKWFVNPIGTVTDYLWSLDGGDEFRWQSGNKVASTVTGDRWTVEMAIPFENLRFAGYNVKDEQGQDLVQIPPPDGTAYRVWFARAIGGNGDFFNAWDAHVWNTTKTKMVLDSKAVSFQVNELGDIMDDVIDVHLTVKNHNNRSETVRVGFFVESAEGTIYSSYEDDQCPDGLLELVPGETRKLHLTKKFPGITTEGNVLWFDVRSAGSPAKPIFLTRLVDFHSMDGGRVRLEDGSEISYRWRRIDVVERMRPPRKEFEFWYNYSAYTNRMSAIVDKGIYGGSDEAQTAVEAKLIVSEAEGSERVIIEVDQAFIGDYCSFLVDMPQMNSGKYRVNLLLFDRNKRIVGEQSPGPFKVGRYEWVKNDKGKNDVVWEPFEPIKVNGKAMETLKHVITLADSGLPAQIYIKPDVRDVPLEHRANPAGAGEKVLTEVGRGNQLRKPLRLEAIVAGQRVEAKVVTPAKITRQWKSEVEYQSKLQAGPLSIALTVQYDCDGSMHVKLNYTAADPVTVEGFELLGDFHGLFDMAVSAAHGGGMEGADLKNCAISPTAKGLVWDPERVERAGLYYSRLIPYFTFGSGDRAFTWICDTDRYFRLDKDGTMMSLEREGDDGITWRVKIVNHPAEVSGENPIEFSLLTHPAKPKPKDFRRLAYFQKGDTWAHLYGAHGAKFGTDAEMKAFAREASGAPADVPDSALATYAKKDPPWNRYYHLRGGTGAIPALMENALTGDLLGEMQVIPNQQTVKRVIDGQEQEITQETGGGMAYMGKAWEDLFAWHWGRQVRLSRRHGFWWDETWPTYRTSNVASGEAYVRDLSTVEKGELPWQDGYVTLSMRSFFKRLARQFVEAGVPQRNYLWANNSATCFESFAWDTMLVEACSSDHSSFELDNVVVYPNALFKYHAHNFTGLVTRICPRDASARNVMSRAGDDERLDRQLLGRALLNDIGVTPTGPHGRFTNLEECIAFINALIDFGYFEADGQTEFLPYWRNGPYVRFGEAPKPGQKDPYKDVHVSVFRRPVLDASGKAKGYKALLLILNESDDPVRAPLHLLDAKRILGGNCTLTVKDVTGEYALPQGASADLAKALQQFAAPATVLKDVEGDGYVGKARNAAGESYGPVHVLPHNYRLLYAESVR